MTKSTSKVHFVSVSTEFYYYLNFGISQVILSIIYCHLHNMIKMNKNIISFLNLAGHYHITYLKNMQVVRQYQWLEEDLSKVNQRNCLHMYVASAFEHFHMTNEQLSSYNVNIFITA